MLKIILIIFFSTQLSFWSYAQITIVNNGKLHIKENQKVHFDGHFTNNSSYFKNKGNLNLTGDFWNYADVVYSGNGIINFIGIDTQYLFMLQAFDTHDFLVDNPKGVSFHGVYDIGVYGNLYFQDGIVKTIPSSMISFMANSKYSGATDFSHISGPAAKSGITDFVFPIGKYGYMRPSGIFELTDTTTFVSEYFAHPHPYTLFDTTLQEINEEEHWSITKEFGVGNAKVGLSYNPNFSSFDNDQNIHIAFLDSMWTKIPSLDNGASPPFYNSNNILTKFGYFNFGRNIFEEEEIKPIDISLSIVERNYCLTELNWMVITEAEIEKFEIEWSPDGIDFINKGKVYVDSTTWTTSKAFQYRDQNSTVDEMMFYRIKIIRPNGEYQYSPVRSFRNKCLYEDCYIYPNPASSDENITVRLKSYFEEEIEVKVADEPGHSLFSQNLNLLKGDYEYEINTKDYDLNSGTYFLYIKDYKTCKFIVIDKN